MASFVTTIMDEECDRLISENLGVNYIDTEVYRANLEIQNRCVAVLNALCNAPEAAKPWGHKALPRALREAGYELYETPTLPHPDHARFFECAHPG
jgi:hypothetical protein